MHSHSFRIFLAFSPTSHTYHNLSTSLSHGSLVMEVFLDRLAREFLYQLNKKPDINKKRPRKLGHHKILVASETLDYYILRAILQRKLNQCHRILHLHI
jgi:hypothetical protein